MRPAWTTQKKERREEGGGGERQQVFYSFPSNSPCRLLSPPSTLGIESPGSTGTEETPPTGSKASKQSGWLSVGQGAGIGGEKWSLAYSEGQLCIFRLGTAPDYEPLSPQTYPVLGPHILWPLSQNFLHPAPPPLSLWLCSFLGLTPSFLPQHKHTSQPCNKKRPRL